MSSLPLSTAVSPEAADAMLAAIQSVAERSFFANAERCDDQSFGELVAAQSSWLVAKVRLVEGPFVGSIVCTLPESLANALFDAFTGRDPSTTAPARDQVSDLVGEFSNMVCGSWLTWIAGGHGFTLSQPIVEPASGPPGGANSMRLFIAVNDLPLAVDAYLVRSVAPGDRTVAHA